MCVFLRFVCSFIFLFQGKVPFIQAGPYLVSEFDPVVSFVGRKVWLFFFTRCSLAVADFVDLLLTLKRFSRDC